MLSDDEKRNRYDRFGEEGLQASGMNGGGRASYHYAYEDEFDPNEIFRMFFGNNFSFGDEGGLERECVCLHSTISIISVNSALSLLLLFRKQHL